MTGVAAKIVSASRTPAELGCGRPSVSMQAQLRSDRHCRSRIGRRRSRDQRHPMQRVPNPYEGMFRPRPVTGHRATLGALLMRDTWSERSGPCVWSLVGRCEAGPLEETRQGAGTARGQARGRDERCRVPANSPDRHR